MRSYEKSRIMRYDRFVHFIGFWVFDRIIHILSDIKLKFAESMQFNKRTYQKTWPRWKILIFGQFQGKKGTQFLHNSWAYFFGHNWANWAELFWKIWRLLSIDWLWENRAMVANWNIGPLVFCINCYSKVFKKFTP